MKKVSCNALEILKSQDLTTFYLGTDSGMLISKDLGKNWEEDNGGLESISVNVFASQDERLYAGTKYNSVWSTDLFVGVDDEIGTLPIEFILHQNYPNPFNPTTTITYAIPLLGGDERGGLVTLKVYDVLGREVARLVNEDKEAGYHSIDFDGVDLPSGVYFYKITTGNYIATRKMLLLK